MLDRFATIYYFFSCLKKGHSRKVSFYFSSEEVCQSNLKRIEIDTCRQELKKYRGSWGA